MGLARCSNTSEALIKSDSDPSSSIVGFASVSPYCIELLNEAALKELKKERLERGIEVQKGISFLNTLDL